MSRAEQQSATLFRSTIRCVVSVLLHAVILAGLIGLIQQTTAAQGSPNPAPSPSPTPTPLTLKIEPAVTQPDGPLTLIFNQQVKVKSVKIGNVDVTGFSQTATVGQLKLMVPSSVSVGRHEIISTVDRTPDPVAVTGMVTVAPPILGLKANPNAPIELSRVVVANGEVILQFRERIPPEIRETLKVRLVEILDEKEKAANKQPATRVIQPSMFEDTYMVLTIPGDIGMDTYEVEVRADDAPVVSTPASPGASPAATPIPPLQKVPKIRVEYVFTMYKWASLVVLGLILLIYILYKLFYKVPEGQPRFTFLKMLLLEQENQTYSLSRAQFAAWTVAIVWSYLFFYYAHGFVEQSWSYPNLGNAVYAFLISLGTLIAAQATNLGQGVKGAGEVHPSLADLVVHGGVLALDRVQQVIWTLIAIGMFIRITVTTYGTASALPDIPMELLGLMGLSSAGYLGGKLVRGPGPVIEQVTVQTDAGVVLLIKGQHLSKQAFVWFDGVQQPTEKVTSTADDPDQPLKFATELQLTLDMTLADWRAKNHSITVVNPDAQRADWRTPAEIVEVTAGAPDAENKVMLTIKSARASQGATVKIVGTEGAQVVQDSADPNLFTVRVDAPWSNDPHQLILTSEGKSTTFSYKPPV
jgi:hypothetical protein